MRKRILLTITAAVLTALSLPGMGLSLTIWFSLAILLFALTGVSHRRGFLLGLLFGLFYYSIAFWWLLPAFVREIPNTFQSFPPIVGFFVYILGAFFLSLYFGVFGLLFVFGEKRYQKRSTSNWKKEVFVLIWVPLLLYFVEYLRSLPPLKFIGMRFSDSLFSMNGIIQLASFGGTEMLVLIIGFINALIFFYLRKRPLRKPRTIITILLIITSIYTTDSIIASFLPAPYVDNSHSITVAGAQTMMTPLNKYYSTEEELLTDLDSMIVESSAEAPELFVLPETYFLFNIAHYPRSTETLESLSNQYGVHIVAPHIIDSEEKTYNAVRLVSPEEGVGEKFYGKRELNPFTEYIPFEKLFGFLSFLQLRSYLDSGPEPSVFEVEDFKMSFPICFEAFFPSVFIEQKQRGAQVFCVISNDGYFTHSVALEQHFRQLQMRAVETRSWVCHVSNNGITGLVDPYGRIIQSSVPFERSISYFDIPYQKPEKTFYSSSRNIILIVLLTAFIACFIFLFMIK